MMDVHVRCAEGDRLVPVNLGGLALSLRGELSYRGGQSPMAQKIRAIDGESGPSVVVRCADRSDALQCLEFAARNGLLVTMTNDRRHPESWDGCQQGIAVDLSALCCKGARLLHEARRA